MALLRNHLLKQASLLTPVQPGQEGPQAPLGKSFDRRQEKDLFLKVGSEIKQLHDLRHAGSCHVAETGQFRIILNRSLPQQPVKADRESHQPGNAGNETAAPFVNG